MKAMTEEMTFILKQTLLLLRVPYYYHGLILIPAWIDNNFHNKVWGEITYPFTNFNSANASLGSNFISLYWADDCLSMLGSKLIHVNKRDPRQSLEALDTASSYTSDLNKDIIILQGSQMSGMTSRTTNNLTLCSTTCQDQQQIIIRVLYNWPFVEELLIDSHHKGAVMLTVFRFG